MSLFFHHIHSSALFPYEILKLNIFVWEVSVKTHYSAKLLKTFSSIQGSRKSSKGEFSIPRGGVAPRKKVSVQSVSWFENLIMFNFMLYFFVYFVRLFAYYLLLFLCFRLDVKREVRLPIVNHYHHRVARTLFQNQLNLRKPLYSH